MSAFTHRFTPSRFIPIGLVVLLLVGVPGHEPQSLPPGGAPLQQTAPSLPWMEPEEPLSFEENRGQFQDSARFVARSRGFRLSLEPSGTIMSLQRRQANDPPVAVRMALVGAEAGLRLKGQEPLPGLNHYFRGSDPASWVQDVASYAKVEYENVYPGIDLVFRADGEGIEYDFIVAPGADPDQILLDFGGVERAWIDSDGDLILETSAGPVRQRRPLLFQKVGGEQREVAGDFVLRGPGEVGFRVGTYDADHVLVIDPVLEYSTLHGGCRGRQGIQDVALDAQGNAYVAGYFPWDCDRGASEAFVAKYDPAGVPLFRTEFGGHFSDEAKALAVDVDGNIYVAGSTQFHLGRPLPAIDAFQPAHGGETDAFVMKIDPTGRTILYSTFLGGAGEDLGADLAVDFKGRIYVSGRTNSTDFPTLHPWQAELEGESDAFVAVFEPSGSRLVFSTYVGGSGEESVARMVLSEPATNIFIAGTTSSSDFPTCRAAFQPAYAGGPSDAFLAVLTPGGVVRSASYLGGSGLDETYGITLDGAGSIYLTGGTNSSDFPTLNPLQPSLSFPPEADAFLTKVGSSRLSSLAYSTYLEVGEDVTCPAPFIFGNDAPCGAVAADADGNAYVTAQGVFVAKVDSAGASRLYTFNGYGGHAIEVRDSVGGAQTAPEIFIAGITREGLSFLFPTFNSARESAFWFETEVGWLTKLVDGPNPQAEFEEDDPRITYTGMWETDVSPEHSGGVALRSMEEGAMAEITFTGTGLQVIGRRDPSAGIVRVNQGWNVNFPNRLLDTHASPRESRSLLLSFSGLPPGTYTITLEVTGTQNRRSSGSWIWIDGINGGAATVEGSDHAKFLEDSRLR